MKFSYIGNQENKDVRIAGSYANSAFSHANAAFLAANTGGSGALSVGSITITVDNFTSNGNTTTYTLSTTPTAEQYVTVGVDGLTQFRNTYNTSGNIITFDSIFEIMCCKNNNEPSDVRGVPTENLPCGLLDSLTTNSSSLFQLTPNGGLVIM
jgi:hypothetical protein